MLAIIHARLMKDLTFSCTKCTHLWTDNIEIGNDGHMIIVFPDICPKCKTLIVELVRK